MLYYTDKKGIDREVVVTNVLTIGAYYEDTTPLGDIWIGIDGKAYLV